MQVRSGGVHIATIGVSTRCGNPGDRIQLVVDGAGLTGVQGPKARHMIRLWWTTDRGYLNCETRGPPPYPLEREKDVVCFGSLGITGA